MRLKVKSACVSVSFCFHLLGRDDVGVERLGGKKKQPKKTQFDIFTLTLKRKLVAKMTER